jgi:hypothetical protein
MDYSAAGNRLQTKTGQALKPETRNPELNLKLGTWNLQLPLPYPLSLIPVFDVSRILVFRKTHFWRGLARFFDPSYPQNDLGDSAARGMQEQC